jgi:HTH-type transcriptional repressor of NAD biosynthesis genes
MKKLYNKALIIGKFQPLHKGHLSLIDFALTKAQSVVVCATAHSAEVIPLEQRVSWLKESYKEGIDVRGLYYDPMLLNASSVSDVKSSEEWADYLNDQFPDFSEIDVLIGSELYVKYMAEYIGIEYIVYDQKRKNVQISATAIKDDIVRFWDYLSPAAKRTYVRHMCICGSESTGKSTTCKRVEEEFNFVTMIPEIGRCLVGKSEFCSFETLRKIFSIHNSLLEAVVFDPPTPIIIWDTDNITTLSYCSYLYPKEKKEALIGGLHIPIADKYFFFESNIDFVDDNTRLAEDAAYALRNNHIQIYQQAGVELEFVTENRLQLVDRFISRLVKQLSKL